VGDLAITFNGGGVMRVMDGGIGEECKVSSSEREGGGGDWCRKRRGGEGEREREEEGFTVLVREKVQYW
jgi:hypothetical protein